MDFVNEVYRGAGALAKRIRGANTKKNRRWIYHQHEKGNLPTWPEGGQIISTEASLRDHYRPRQATGQMQETSQEGD
jgi:hypothetical protein